MAADREADVSIRAVTRAAGTVPQSFYLQFSSLDELLYEVYALEFEDLRQAMTHAAGSTPDAVTRLRAVCAAYCSYALAYPGRYRALFGVRGQARHQEWDGRPLPGAPAFSVLTDTVGGALAVRRSQADPFLTASTLWACLHGVITLRADRPRLPVATPGRHAQPPRRPDARAPVPRRGRPPGEPAPRSPRSGLNCGRLCLRAASAQIGGCRLT
jgi:AcrR family transcriptional regulator